ncbi:tetratricopeptide repeat protein [Flavobacteriaceae bacterium]|nr:tetratricopeptide repeat protein [Flavobacteriaceae bacterium]
MEYLSFDEKDPNAEFPKAFTSAQAKYESSKYKEAIVDLNKAIEIQPKYANSYLLKGMCKAQLKDKNGACVEWRKAKLLGSESATRMLKKYCSDSSKIDDKLRGYPTIEEYLAHSRKKAEARKKMYKQQGWDWSEVPYEKVENLEKEYNEVMEFASRNRLGKGFVNYVKYLKEPPYVAPKQIRFIKFEIQKDLMNGSENLEITGVESSELDKYKNFLYNEKRKKEEAKELIKNKYKTLVKNKEAEKETKKVLIFIVVLLALLLSVLIVALKGLPNNS